MHIICLTPLAPGVYNDHSADHIVAPPAGWAYIPQEGGPIPIEWQGKEIDFSKPSTFPRLGSLEAQVLTYTKEIEGENGKKQVVPYTMLTVTVMTEGTLPDPEPKPEPVDEPTVWDELDAAYQEGVNSV